MSYSQCFAELTQFKESTQRWKFWFTLKSEKKRSMNLNLSYNRIINTMCFYMSNNWDGWNTRESKNSHK